MSLAFSQDQPGASRRDQALFLRCLWFHHKAELSNEFIKVQILSPVPEFVDCYGVDLSKLTVWLPSDLGISCFDKHYWKTSCVRVSSDRTCRLCSSPFCFCIWSVGGWQPCFRLQVLRWPFCQPASSSYSTTGPGWLPRLVSPVPCKFSYLRQLGKDSILKTRSRS